MTDPVVNSPMGELVDGVPAPAENGAASRRNGHAPSRFGRRLAFAFATVAALTAILAGALLSVAWTFQFNQYVRAGLQSFANGVSTIVAAYYPIYGYDWGTLAQIPMQGQSSIGVQVFDAKGQLVYDETSMRSHMLALVKAGGAARPSIQASPTAVVLNPKGPVVTSPVIVSGKQVGLVRVWAYSSAGSLMTDRDLQFRQGSFLGLAVAAFAAIMLASLAGLAYSRRLVQPIGQITATAQALRAGDREARTGMEPTDEIGYLGRTFDQMADSIEADREMERRLTADVAHELRTPLQAIQATVEAMQDGVLPADEEHLGIVRDETVRLGRLAGGILELTRLERGSVSFKEQRLDLAIPVRAALDTHTAMLESCDISTTARITDGVFVVADPDRLTQAVGNLLSNAARYTPAGGSVEISLERSNGTALIEVADTGIGIAEEDLTRVFSRFWRANAARDRSSGGLGIGLAVTKEIVERMGGTISARRREGGGTVFSIALPLT